MPCFVAAKMKQCDTVKWCVIANSLRLGGHNQKRLIMCYRYSRHNRFEVAPHIPLQKLTVTIINKPVEIPKTQIELMPVEDEPMPLFVEEPAPRLRFESFIYKRERTFSSVYK